MGAVTLTEYPKCIPGLTFGKATASDGDTVPLIKGAPIEAMVFTTDDDDVIASGVCSGQSITFGLIDDGGSAQGSDQDLVFMAINNPG